MRCLRIAGVASLVCVMAVSAQAANILVVGGSFGDNNDEALRTALQDLGHFVPNPVADFAAAPPTAADLAETDLILVSRSANSGNYDDTINGMSEAELWNELDVPMVVMSAAHIRGGVAGGNSRWGLVNSLTTVDNAPLENLDPFPNAGHPFVAGRSTDIFPPTNVVDVTVDYINTQDIPGGATIVATMTHMDGTAEPPINNTFAAIVDYPAGTTLFTDNDGAVAVTTARRAYMQMHDYQDNANVFSLTSNGLQILDQIIRTLAPTTSVPADVNGSGTTDVADYNIIRTNFFGTGKTYAQGDVTGDGVVNFADFRYWTQFNGATAAGPAAGLGAVVPEPGSIALALFGALALAGGALRRRVR